MEKEDSIYKPNWDTLRKTVTIINEDNSIYAELDYIDWLQFRIEYNQSERMQKQKYYIRNEYGGINIISKDGVTGSDPFQIVNKLLKIIIKSKFQKLKR